MLNDIWNRAWTRMNDDEGFTLIELLVVIVVLGVLAGIVVFSAQGVNDRGEEAACQSEVKTVAVAEEAHYAQEGSYATIPGLVAADLLRGEPTYVTAANATTGALTTDGTCDAA